MSKFQINEATAIQEGLHIFNDDPSNTYVLTPERKNIIKDYLRYSLNLKEDITDEQFQDLIPDAFELEKIEDELSDFLYPDH